MACNHLSPCCGVTHVLLRSAISRVCQILGRIGFVHLYHFLHWWQSNPTLWTPLDTQDWEVVLTSREGFREPGIQGSTRACVV